MFEIVPHSSPPPSTTSSFPLLFLLLHFLPISHLLFLLSSAILSPLLSPFHPYSFFSSAFVFLLSSSTTYLSLSFFFHLLFVSFPPLISSSFTFSFCHIHRFLLFFLLILLPLILVTQRTVNIVRLQIFTAVEVRSV